MYFERGRTAAPSTNGPEGVITGLMSMDTRLSANGVGINGVVFQAGARTNWHSHTVGQIFLVTLGRGIVATRERTQIIQAGDVLYTPAGEQHWHGGAPDSFVAYTAISLGTTDWAEALLDSEYLEAFRD